MPQTSQQPTLLLTRPKPQSEAFLAEIGNATRAIISPLLQIVQVSTLPDLSAYASVVVTSPNAVTIAGDALQGARVYTVGDMTAQRARAHGAHATALGENIERFLARRDEIEGPALIVRGVHARGCVIGQLAELGITARECVLYDQVAAPLTTEAAAVLNGDASVVAPIFSPRTAEILASHGPFAAPLHVVAMSPAVSDAWSGPAKVSVAAKPMASAMKEMTIKALEA